ncbi:MAG: hypothetical protein ACLFUT_09650 [Desulfobacteraceae bacterium]
MKDSLRTGISFGLTSAVITTLELMVGLRFTQRRHKDCTSTERRVPKSINNT